MSEWVERGGPGRSGGVGRGLVRYAQIRRVRMNVTGQGKER